MSKVIRWRKPAARPTSRPPHDAHIARRYPARLHGNELVDVGGERLRGVEQVAEDRWWCMVKCTDIPE
jgi:hypothetical protein